MKSFPGRCQFSCVLKRLQIANSVIFLSVQTTTKRKKSKVSLMSTEEQGM